MRQSPILAAFHVLIPARGCSLHWLYSPCSCGSCIVEDHALTLGLTTARSPAAASVFRFSAFSAPAAGFFLDLAFETVSLSPASSSSSAEPCAESPFQLRSCTQRPLLVEFSCAHVWRFVLTFSCSDEGAKTRRTFTQRGHSSGNARHGSGTSI